MCVCVCVTQAKELLDHLEGVLSNKPVELVHANSAVEIKPQGVSKGQAVERMLSGITRSGDCGDMTSTSTGGAGAVAGGGDGTGGVSSGGAGGMGQGSSGGAPGVDPAHIAAMARLGECICMRRGLKDMP